MVFFPCYLTIYIKSSKVKKLKDRRKNFEGKFGHIISKINEHSADSNESNEHALGSEY